jgi:hypothetical protein
MKAMTWAFVAALLLASGCGGGSDSVTEAPIDLNGHSLGIAAVTGGSAYPPNATYPILFDLVQTGDSVTGSYQTTYPDGETSGTVAGSLSGRTFNFTLTENAPCAGSFDGTATVASTGMSFNGAYRGADCSGTTEAYFSVSK